MMLLVNLAEVDWIQIDCDKKLLPNVLCSSTMTGVNSEKNSKPLFVNDITSCIKTQIVKNYVIYVIYFCGIMECMENQ